MLNNINTYLTDMMGPAGPLIAMGVLPEDQAMMGRMMMGMFARTVGEDQLSTTIEVNSEGHVLANGQRIQ